MKKILLALFLLAAVTPAAAQQSAQPILCNKVGIGQSLAAGTTQIIAGVAGQIINWCGYKMDMNANGTIQLVFGTGSTCTSATNVTANITTLTNDHLVNHLNFAFLSSAPGQSLCAIVTGTGSVVNMSGYYQQSP